MKKAGLTGLTFLDISTLAYFLLFNNKKNNRDHLWCKIKRIKKDKKRSKTPAELPA
jgi:hypothetical protein